MKITTHSPEETEAAGERFAKGLKPGDVAALFGGLGMGKTAFVRGMARGLSIEDDVSSPTYALVHEYRGALPMVHFDMYRVSGWEDLASTGFYDYLESDCVCAVEWSENIEEALPDYAFRISFERGEAENDRVITMDAPSAG